MTDMLHMVRKRKARARSARMTKQSHARITSEPLGV
jgi:hypothetical protein